MDIKKIRAMLVAADCGSLSSAAEKLGYTQSGLTHMMNSLESELGVNLLIRSKTGVQLSDEAKALLPYMQSLLKASDELETAASQLCEQGRSVLRLGAYSSMARHWLPTVLANFREVSPETDVEMYVGGMPDIYEMLHDGRLDCAFISHQASLCRNLRYISLRDDPLLAILPADAEIKGNNFPVERFSGHEFIMPSDGFELDIAPVFGGEIDSLVKSVKRINFDDAALVSMVEHKLGVTILSELVMRGMNYKVLQLPLNPPACRYLGIAVKEKNYKKKAIQSFIKCTRSTLETMY